MSAKKDAARNELDIREPYFHIQAGGRYVIVEIAGMQQGEFNVALTDRRLTITGFRQMPARARAAYHQLEVRYGEFRCDVSLPWAVDEQGIVARYEDGFLYIELPRSQADAVRPVPVDKK
jgi:HSP20 family protein